MGDDANREQKAQIEDVASGATPRETPIEGSAPPRLRIQPRPKPERVKIKPVERIHIIPKPRSNGGINLHEEEELTCQFCRTTIKSGQVFVQCPRCHKYMHSACWDTAGRCATLQPGCFLDET